MGVRCGALLALLVGCASDREVDWQGHWNVEGDAACEGRRLEASLPEDLRIEVLPDGRITTVFGVWWALMPYVPNSCTLTWTPTNETRALLDSEPCTLGQMTPGAYHWIAGVLRRVADDEITMQLEASWTAADASAGCSYSATATLTPFER